MTQIVIMNDELYPHFSLVDDPGHGVKREVDEETLARWTAAVKAFAEVQAEMHDLYDPPCPECGDRTSRHQRWSAGWGRWACLDCKKCQHGIPADQEVDHR